MLQADNLFFKPSIVKELLIFMKVLYKMPYNT